MPEPAANVYRVERDSDANPKGRKSPLGRAIGTALTGLPMPASKLKWGATLRILDGEDTVVYEESGDQTTIDSLELQILQDLMKLDVDAFRLYYNIPEPAAGSEG